MLGTSTTRLYHMCKNFKWFYAKLVKIKQLKKWLF